MEKKKEIHWIECFGNTRQYTLLMVKSQLEPVRFAAKLAKLYQRNFSFIADYAPDRDRPDITFPTFFSVLDMAKDVKMLVMANRTSVASEQPSGKDSFLDTIPMFEDVFYFFNQKGDKQLFKGTLKNFDFLVVLYSDKNYAAREVLETLFAQPTFMAVDVSDYLQKEVQKSEARKRILVLQNLIEYFGVMMNKKLEDKLKARLRNKEIPMSNYVHRRFQIDQVITSSLLQREDI